jgi:hypothetical protein
VIRAILNPTSGVRYRAEYGNGPYLATINPEQIIRPPEIKGRENVNPYRLVTQAGIDND